MVLLLLRAGVFAELEISWPPSLSRCALGDLKTELRDGRCPEDNFLKAGEVSRRTGACIRTG